MAHDLTLHTGYSLAAMLLKPGRFIFLMDCRSRTRSRERERGSKEQGVMRIEATAIRSHRYPPANMKDAVDLLVRQSSLETGMQGVREGQVTRVRDEAGGRATKAARITPYRARGAGAGKNL